MNANRFHFRVWDKDQKFFVTSALEIAGGTFSSRTHNLTVRHHDFILMQSTGLCDKNGKEIFDGDVIIQTIEDSEWNRKHFGVTKTEKRKALIKWSDDDAGFVVSFEPHMKMHPCYECMRLADSDAEIIGNLYQNPELLEEGKL